MPSTSQSGSERELRIIARRFARNTIVFSTVHLWPVEDSFDVSGDTVSPKEPVLRPACRLEILSKLYEPWINRSILLPSDLQHRWSKSFRSGVSTSKSYSSKLITCFSFLARNALKGDIGIDGHLFMLQRDKCVHFCGETSWPLANRDTIQGVKLYSNQHRADGGRNIRKLRIFSLPDQPLQLNKPGSVPKIALLPTSHTFGGWTSQREYTFAEFVRAQSNKGRLLSWLQSIYAGNDS